MYFAGDDGLLHQLLFLLPMGVIFTMNCVFFALTAAHVNAVKREIAQRQGGLIAEKSRLRVIWRIFIVMGIAWALELITSLTKDEFILWLIADWYNVIHGVFVFFIFVFKTDVLNSLRRRGRFLTRRIQRAC